MRRIGIIAAALVLLATAVTAQELTTVGVVDTDQIFQVYFRESRAVRQLEELAASIRTQRAELQRELERLETQRAAAQDSGNRERVLQLDEEITEQRDFIREFERVREAEFNSRRDAVLSLGDETFLEDLIAAIRFVAQLRGITVVLDAGEPGLLWWAQEVDMTEDVLARLQQLSQ